MLPSRLKPLEHWSERAGCVAKGLGGELQNKDTEGGSQREIVTGRDTSYDRRVSCGGDDAGGGKPELLRPDLCLAPRHIWMGFCRNDSREGFELLASGLSCRQKKSEETIRTSSEDEDENTVILVVYELPRETHFWTR